MGWTEADDAHLSTWCMEGFPRVTRDGNRVTQLFVFDQPWEVVFAAHESRYPTHPDLPLLVSSRVVERDRSRMAAAGRESFRRELVLSTAVPRVLAALVGGDRMEFEERWEVDHAARRASKVGRNLSWRDGSWGMRLDETLEFVVHRDNPGWTWVRPCPCCPCPLPCPHGPLSGVWGLAVRTARDAAAAAAPPGRQLRRRGILRLKLPPGHPQSPDD